jgi:2-polyprenyl-6-hydroxyphenyl methylase/3-demethylubiquinone-9 3-methyltransferase
MSVSGKERFAFGANWQQFLRSVTPERVALAKASLSSMLGTESLEGGRFLDIGCGSGLFSLAARELGAHVHSFDYDRQSVVCAQVLKQRFRPDDPHWTIEIGSALDEHYIRGLGTFDNVYAWGVLHHTGDMWRALDLAGFPCAPGGKLFLAIYNDQGAASRVWLVVKKLYNTLPPAFRMPYLLGLALPFESVRLLVSVFRGQPIEYFRGLIGYPRQTLRGMNRWNDFIDWIGGYPFEVAKPEEIFDFYKLRGFELTRLSTCGGALGCNQFVFEYRP